MVLSISYDVPVIVPEMGCMGDYVKHGWNGFLYSPHDSNALINTLNLALNSHDHGDIQGMCKKYSETHKIANTADEICDVYKEVIK